MALKRWFCFVAAALVCAPNWAAAQERIFQTGETSSMESPKRNAHPAFLLGGGGNVVIANNDVLDSIAGGVVKGRVTLHDLFSIETSFEFNKFPVLGVDGKTFRSAGLRSDADGSMYGFPLIPTLLIHLPPMGNLRPYIFGGVGYQFNDADTFDVDVRPLAGGPVTRLDVDVEDGAIGVWGGGVDIVLTEHLVLNLDARYQSAEFDIEAKGVVGGVPVSIEEKEENFDAVALRGALLYRF